MTATVSPEDFRLILEQVHNFVRTKVRSGAASDDQRMLYIQAFAAPIERGGAVPGAEAYAAQGVDRLVVGTTSTDLNEQLRQLEAFATLHGLRR